MAQLFREMGLGSLPKLFWQLAGAPHLLEAQRILLEESLGPRDGADLNFRRFTAVGLATCREIGATDLGEQIAACVQSRDTTPGDQDTLILRFARDVTLHSNGITHERVDELRDSGLDDRQILDLVCTIAFWNACGRAEILLTYLPQALAQPVAGR
jgi:hypothetical protein